MGRTYERLEAVKQTSVSLDLKNLRDFINASMAGEARGPANSRNETVESLDSFVLLLGKSPFSWPGCSEQVQTQGQNPGSFLAQVTCSGMSTLTKHPPSGSWSQTFTCILICHHVPSGSEAGNSNAVMQRICFRDQLPLCDTAPGLAPCDHPGRLSSLCYPMVLPKACNN